MERYDEHLQFNLKPGYVIRKGKNDEGNDFYKILFNVSKDNEGNETAEITIGVSARKDLSIPEDKINVEGNFPAWTQGVVKEMQVAFLSLNILTSVLIIQYNEQVYVLNSHGVVRGEDGLNERAKLVAKHFTAVLNSMVLGGTKASFKPITAQQILDQLNAAEEEAEKAAAEEEANSPFRRAVPGKGQHTHLDFQRKSRAGLGFLGGMVQVNATGTEYSFENLTEHLNYMDPGEEKRIVHRAVDTNKEFALAQRALEMSRLFRMDYDFFDAGHDREQEILHGLIQRAGTYNGLRSFAWTLSAYCAENKTKPEKVTMETLESLAEYLEKRDWLNYQADANCPTLCSGDDIHVYYLPDAVTAQERKALLAVANADNDADAPQVSTMSLEGLRKDLTYLYPAMKTIHDALAAQRDPEEVLEGGVADVLYAWCSMTYAAREPIYTEDGPMNNWFQHPDEQLMWEEKWRKEREERMRKAAEEWMEANGKHVTKNPRINFSGTKFVFSGVEHRDDWPEILEKLTKKGALHRGAVSGQTDYLVCDPRVCGDSKVKAALTQNLKGKNVKIILLEDFLKALGMQQQKKEEPVEEKKPAAPAAAKPVKKEVKEVDLTGMTTVTLTYDQGLKAGNDDYEIAVPDGFKIKMNVEDRDFIAWLPAESDPEDWLESSFILYAGQENRGTADKLATMEEFVARARAAFLATSVSGMFEKYAFIPCEDPALPGGISVAYDGDVMLANVYAAVSDYEKGMCLQISGVEAKNRPAYEKLVKDFFGRMKAKKPVKLLGEVDDPYFTQKPLTEELAKEWDQRLSDHIDHIGTYRAILQNGYVQKHQRLQSQGKGSLPRLRKEIKDTLREAVELTETLIEKAEAVYRKISADNSGNKALLSMRASMVKLLDAADQTVTLDDQEMKVESELSRTVRTRLDTPEVKALRKEEEYRRRREAEEKRREKNYQEAVKCMTSDDLGTVKKAEELFKELGDYQEAAQKREECKVRIEQLKKEAERKAEEARREKSYQEAIKLMNTNKEEALAKAEELFKKLGKHKDAEQKREECRARIEKMRKEAEEKRHREEEERKRKEEEERQRKLAEEERIRAKKAKQKKTLIRVGIVAALLVLAYIISMALPVILRAAGKLEPEFDPYDLTLAQEYVKDVVEDYDFSTSKYDLKAARILFIDDLKTQFAGVVKLEKWDLSGVKAAVVFYVGPDDGTDTEVKLDKWVWKSEEPVTLEVGEDWFPVLYLLDGEGDVVYSYDGAASAEGSVSDGAVDQVDLQNLRMELAQAELEKEQRAEKYADKLGDFPAMVETKMAENPDYLYTLECWLDCRADGRNLSQCHTYANSCRTVYKLEKRLAALSGISADELTKTEQLLDSDEKLLDQKKAILTDYDSMLIKMGTLEKNNAKEIAALKAAVEQLKEQENYFYDETLMRAALENSIAKTYNEYLRQEHIYLTYLQEIDKAMAITEMGDRDHLLARNNTVMTGFADYSNVLLEQMQCVLDLEKYEKDNADTIAAYEKEEAEAKEKAGANYAQSVDYLKVQIKYEQMLKERESLNKAVEKAKANAETAAQIAENNLAELDKNEAERLDRIAILAEQKAFWEAVIKEAPMVSEYDAQKGEWGLLHRDFAAYGNEHYWW